VKLLAVLCQFYFNCTIIHESKLRRESLEPVPRSDPGAVGLGLLSCHLLKGELPLTVLTAGLDLLRGFALII